LLALSVLSLGVAAQTAAPTPPPNASGDAAAGSDESAIALAKKLQNPVGDLDSFPFQNNTNFNPGRTRARRTVSMSSR
jgi:hypothetical protein